MIISLLLLLVMTVLALGASQATRLQERMAGNARDHDLALQSAEAGLRAGERTIFALLARPSLCVGPPCKFYELNSPDTLGPGPITKPLQFRDDKWWATNALDYAATSTISDPLMARMDPSYLVEEVEEVFDTLSESTSGVRPSRIHYRITSRGVGGSTTSAVVLQTTWARRF